MAEKNDLEIRFDRALVKQFTIGGQAAVKYGIGNPCFATNTCKPEDWKRAGGCQTQGSLRRAGRGASRRCLVRQRQAIGT